MSAGPPLPAVGDPRSDGSVDQAVSVLLVDDNAAKRLAIRAVLSSLGYTIVEADSGLAALRCVMLQEFAVILLDVRMHGMDGFETAALIRQRVQSEMTPIIFVTAHGSGEIDRYAQGAVDFICAPVVPDELRAKVSVFANLFIKANRLATRAKEVETSADRLRLLTDTAPIGIFHTDRDNRYIYTNPRWTEITGMAAEAAAGQEWDAIIGSVQSAALAVEFPDGAFEREELCHRFELRTRDLGSRTVLMTSRSIPDPGGGVAGWVGTLADVTAEAGAEAAMSDARDKANEASQLKSDFLANMSHEIRTPMNGVIGMTDLLLETDLDARQRDFAQTVRNSGQALLAIIDDILDFSKIEAGKLEIERIELDLRAVVEDVVDLLAGSAQAKGIEVITAIESTVPAIVVGDPGRVRQVLTNLIDNSIKFTRAGEIVIRVTAGDHARTDTLVRFEVSDSGEGIAAEKLATIFQPFVQADTSTSREHGGTGLGLAISSQLVALMGGDCGASSRIGVGSTFWFTIRAHCDVAPAGIEVSATDPALAGALALVVDDNATHVRVVSKCLTDWGMTVRGAESGVNALASMRAAAALGRPFAVVLIDRSMPGMDGLALIDGISADPRLTAGLVLMTGLGEQGDLGDAAASGRFEHLSKPVHRDELRRCLRGALGWTAVEVVSAALSASSAALSGVHRGGRLLLAEDNLINQKVAVAMLSGAGYRVDTVLNGAEAVEAVAARRYDAILMDCQMPELNGYQATAAIRDHEGQSRHTPIIAMTAGARGEDRDRCLAEGMDSYLAKPVSRDALLQAVAQAVRGPLAAGAAAA